MALANLDTGGLYIILFIRNDPHILGDFHWALYLHRDPLRGGTKYHVKQQGGGWIADHGPTAGVLKSFLLIGLFQIALVPAGRESDVDGALRTYDHSLNMAGITCRVWILRVLALLQNPTNGYSILKCPELKALEEEIKVWGNENAASAALNRQPRPIAWSKLCGL